MTRNSCLKCSRTFFIRSDPISNLFQCIEVRFCTSNYGSNSVSSELFVINCFEFCNTLIHCGIKCISISLCSSFSSSGSTSNFIVSCETICVCFCSRFSSSGRTSSVVVSCETICVCFCSSFCGSSSTSNLIVSCKTVSICFSSSFSSICLRSSISSSSCFSSSLCISSSLLYRTFTFTFKSCDCFSICVNFINDITKAFTTFNFSKILNCFFKSR